MPELPEVETIRRGLSKFILNKKLVHVVKTEGSSSGALRGASPSLTPSDESSVFTPATLVSLRRFGKALVMDFDNGWSLMVHLRMTGQLIWRGEERFAGGHPSENFVAELPNKQTRVIFEFEDGKLYFNDQRKFGFVKVLRTDEVMEDEFIRKLAKEPWEMSTEEFYGKLQRHKNALIKAVLLDQTIICGLGNIYADEALFFAGVHPATRVGNLTKEEVARILEGARVMMKKSIDAGGSTMATYVRPDGTRGDYLEKFAKVFRREGQKCVNCGCEIVKIRVAGRGTHICPHCQEVK